MELYAKEYMERLRNETEYAINQAGQGLLSPHWQASARLELEESQASSFYDAQEGASLRQRLDKSISEHEQIGDEALARLRIEERGDFLPYYYSNEDHWTLMEIVQAKAGFYTACVYIDKAAYSSNQTAYLNKLKDSLKAWALLNNVALPLNSACPPKGDDSEEMHFDSIDSAAAYLWFCLMKPDDYLIN